MTPLLPIDWAALWRAQVAAEHAQYERLCDPRLRPGPDWWATQAEQFHRRSRAVSHTDALLQAALARVHPGATVLDIGAGTGRYALPLARAGAHVIAIDSSPAMLHYLQQEAAAEALPITIIAERWETSTVPVADLAICAHVLYPIADAELFLRKLDAHARHCWLLLNYEAPTSWMAPLWRVAYGEERLPLPGALEALALLHQLGIDAHLTPIPNTVTLRFASLDEALAEIRVRLCLASTPERDTRLREALTTLLEPLPDGSLRAPQPPHSALITWDGAPTRQG
ncbi:class I SAM-dependent methyltransferase [Kallotenue papyrolyticum]|uniref:class I SAM-dependent methyltransferase n=1 Tax=Kallotenue papyrolyticum TaxID=1325125 RepID=UPI000471C7B1|nr:methyltransferase domain-containing protein [Kallotenue papyrolyticum]